MSKLLITIVFWQIILFASCSEITDSDRDILRDTKLKKAAIKCCSLEHRQCCYEEIHYNQPIGSNCLNPMSDGQRLQAVECIEGELRDTGELRRMNISSRKCCETFSPNQNDPTRQCRRICYDNMYSVGLSSTQKLHHIHDCLHHNPIFDCFQECVAQTRHSTVEFDRTCMQAKRSIPGKTLIWPSEDYAFEEIKFANND